MSDQIRVITYNTHLFQGTVVPEFRGPERQAGIIAGLTGAAPAYDVIGLTEVWAHETQRAFQAALAPEYAVYAYQDEPALALSSGMVLAARNGFRFVDFIPYEGMVGWDDMAWKGVALARTVIAGHEIALVQTHTQATYDGDEAEDEAARGAQIQATLLPAVRKAAGWGLPTLLLGDLNIVAGTPESNAFASDMAAEGFQDAWVAVNGNDPGYTYDPATNPLVTHWDESQTTAQRLDYMFCKGLTPVSMAVETSAFTVSTDEGVLPDSDHFALTGVFSVD